MIEYYFGMAVYTYYFILLYFKPIHFIIAYASIIVL